MRLAATLAWGLPSDCRVRRSLRSENTPLPILLQTAILDQLRILVWRTTQDGQKGRNPPEMLLEKFAAGLSKQGRNGVTVFRSPEDFEARRQAIMTS